MVIVVSKTPHELLHIINDTRDRVLADRCEIARTFLTRGRGLLGRNTLEQGQGLIIYPSSSIHTFFMRFAIDVLFVDRQDRVVGLREAMPPGLPYAGDRGARYVIELPAGVIATTATRTGDQLNLTPSPHPGKKNGQ